MQLPHTWRSVTTLSHSPLPLMSLIPCRVVTATALTVLVDVLARVFLHCYSFDYYLAAPCCCISPCLIFSSSYMSHLIVVQLVVFSSWLLHDVLHVLVDVWCMAWCAAKNGCANKDGCAKADVPRMDVLVQRMLGQERCTSKKDARMHRTRRMYDRRRYNPEKDAENDVKSREWYR